MPVTTILQHQRERDGLTQPDVDTPMPDHGQSLSMREELEEVRLRWALGVEQHVKVSLLTEKEKTAAARWFSPDASYSVEVLNRPVNPGPSIVSTPSTDQAFSGVYNANQAGGRAAGKPQEIPPGGHNARQQPLPYHNPTPRAYEMRQRDSQQWPPKRPNSGRISPDLYHVTHRAVNALRARKQGETASNDSNSWPVSNPRLDEQAAPRTYNPPYTPPASLSRAQTSSSEYNGAQVPYTDYYTGHPSPVDWSAVRASPHAPNAIEAESRLRQNVIDPRQQGPSATTSNPPHQTLVWQHAYSQPAMAPPPPPPPPPPPQHPVRSAKSVMSLKSIVAPQSPVVSHSTMPARSERPSQPEATPSFPAASYPATAPQPVLASQAMGAPQPVYTHPAPSQQATHSQIAYTEPTYAQPPYSGPCYTQPAFSEHPYPQPCAQPGYPGPRCSVPGCSDPECWVSDNSRPYYPQPVYPQPVAASQQAYTEAIPRSFATSHSTTASNPPATQWPAEVSQASTAVQQPVPPQHTMSSQPIPLRPMTTSHDAGFPQPLVIRPAKANGSRNSPGETGREGKKVPEARDPPSLSNPKGSAIVNMTPSVGNKLVEFLMVYAPSMVAGSQLSSTLPKETAAHYNSVLAYQAQSIGLSFPHGRPEFHNGVDPRLASPQAVPASQEAQQTLNRGVTGMASASSHGDIQEVSQRGWQAANKGNLGRQDDIQVVTRQHWQAANKDTSGRQFDQGAQPVAASVPPRIASQTPSSAPAKTNNVPQPYVNNIKGKMALPRIQRPVSEKRSSAKAQAAPTKAQTASTRVQAPRKAKAKSKQAPASGGIQKRKSSRVRQTTPPRGAAPHSAVPKAAVPQTAVPRTTMPQTAVPQAEVPHTALLPHGREQQPTVHVSGSGMELTQDDVDRWQEERQNPYHLPSFNDAFGHISMDICLNDHEQTPYEAGGGRSDLAAYRI